MSSSTRRSLKIGFVYDDSLDSDDGVAQYVKRLGLWLESQGHRVSYLVGESKTSRWGSGDVYSLSSNLTVRWGGNRLSIPAVSSSRKIKATLSSGNFDVLHVQFPYSPLMAQKVIKNAQPKTAVVATIHVPSSSFLTDLGSRLLKFWYGSSLRQVDSFVSVSQVAKKYAHDIFGVESKVVPNTVSIKDFAVVKKPAAKTKRIVFLGRLAERKGCKYLINAFAILASEMDNVELVIAGDGPQRRLLEALVRHKGLEEQVKFLGHIAEKQKPALLASADIACFPSIYGESFGIVLIEAMAAGAGVVIGGNNPGYTSVLGEQSILLVEPKKIDDFADRLKFFLDDKDLADKMNSWQRQTVRQYDIEIVGRKILKVYETAIAKAAKRRHN